MDDKELFRTKFPPTRWAVQDLMPDGFGIIAAKKGVGKSWLVDQIALEIAYNRPVLGALQPYPGNVVIISYEDTGFTLQQRLTQQRESLGITETNGRLHVYNDWPTVEDGGLEKLKSLILDLEPRIVFIDVLRRFQTTAGAYTQASNRIQKIAELASELRTGIWGVMHMYRGNISPSAPDWLDRIQGSIGITGAAHTVIGLTRMHDENDAALRITGKVVREQTYALKWDPEKVLWTIGGDVATAGMSEIRKDILGVVIRRNGATSGEISDDLGKPSDTVYQRIWQMVKAGQLFRLDGDGNGAIYVTEDQYKAIKADQRNHQTGFEDWFSGKLAPPS